MDAKDLYLDLLAKSLTNTLFISEPDADDESQAQYIKGFIEHYISGTAITMLPMARMNNLKNCVVDTIEKHIPGDLIETGVWRGGATIFMRAILTRPKTDSLQSPLITRHHGNQALLISSREL